MAEKTIETSLLYYIAREETNTCPGFIFKLERSHVFNFIYPFYGSWSSQFVGTFSDTIQHVCQKTKELDVRCLRLRSKLLDSTEKLIL